MATQVLHAPPSPSPSSRTATGRFHDTCIEWLRDHEQLHTRVLPGEHIPVDDDGFARVRGHLVASSRTGAIAFAGLVALVASWLLLELGDRLARLEVGPTVVALGWALVVAGVFALCGAWWEDRRTRTAVLVLLDGAPAPVSAERLQPLAAGPAATERRWVIARGGFEPEALELAATLGIRCETSPRVARG
ncbi:MAG: hypothetical protein H6712_26945 [Myxococcales bacterium]|nr:hypothetical protein [Myxococcales bacterium]MCB9717514.1 hypothetical protein [Myxococcales bacterium]